jgi:AbrB family looped-hinge helix DNA binding protein
MVKARITSKGQITIPKRVRDDLGLTTGDHVDFVAEGRDGYAIRPIRAASSTQAICDRLVKPGVRASVNDMKRAVAAAVARRFAQAVRGSKRS